MPTRDRRQLDTCIELILNYIILMLTCKSLQYVNISDFGCSLFFKRIFRFSFDISFNVWFYYFWRIIYDSICPVLYLSRLHKSMLTQKEPNFDPPTGVVRVSRIIYLKTMNCFVLKFQQFRYLTINIIPINKNYLVDPASINMFASKIKPCKFQPMGYTARL